jgi:hypothetical protein
MKAWHLMNEAERAEAEELLRRCEWIIEEGNRETREQEERERAEKGWAGMAKVLLSK